jgi:predicted TIM-barrel fold metal-dependent hydrolase
VLLPTVAPDVTWVKPLYHPDYDRLWAALQDLELPVNLHAGTGSPSYGRFASTPAIMITEVGFYGARPFVHMLLSGVFERFPRLKFVMTEMGCAWMPPMLRNFDRVLAQIRETGRMGEMRYKDEDVLPKSATEYFRQNCWMGVSQPGPDDAAAVHEIGLDRFMWGSDYPHNEGTGPFTREHLRQRFCDAPEAEMRKILAENAAELYGFDLAALAPLAERVGPTVAEIAQPLTELPEHPNEALLRI